MATDIYDEFEIIYIEEFETRLFGPALHVGIKILESSEKLRGGAQEVVTIWPRKKSEIVTHWCTKSEDFLALAPCEGMKLRMWTQRIANKRGQEMTIRQIYKIPETKEGA